MANIFDYIIDGIDKEYEERLKKNWELYTCWLKQ